jgi:hypothetical protein
LKTLDDDVRTFLEILAFASSSIQCNGLSTNTLLKQHLCAFNRGVTVRSAKRVVIVWIPASAFNDPLKNCNRRIYYIVYTAESGKPTVCGSTKGNKWVPSTASSQNRLASIKLQTIVKGSANRDRRSDCDGLFIQEWMVHKLSNHRPLLRTYRAS